jgi:XTP/dITP diphosphohydrolase
VGRLKSYDFSYGDKLRLMNSQPALNGIEAKRCLAHTEGASRSRIVRLIEVVLGTHNRKKCEELRMLLEPSGLRVRPLADFPDPLTVVEDGSSFGEIAVKKAVAQAQHLGQWVLGEDSGLMVDALGGAPGIHSARYAGPQACDEENNQRLLGQLAGRLLQERAARYVCHATVADPEGTIRIDCEATCRGRIALAPRGTAGFGYDPLFEIIEYHRTFAELGDVIKGLLSHRARAMQQVVRQLARCAVTAPSADGASPSYGVG